MKKECTGSASNIMKEDSMMLNKKCLLAAFAAAICLAIPAYAGSFTTSDGVLTLQLPNDNWHEVKDASRWVVLSDGTDKINIDHYSNGEDIPAMPVADSQYANVIYDAFSTRNEVFILTGLVVNPGTTSSVRDAIRSAQILIYDTKKAVTRKKAQTNAASSQTQAANNNTGNTTGASTEDSVEKVQCEYCGAWLETGNIFRNHMCPEKEAALAQENTNNGDDLVQCEYCGAWLHTGNEYRNHMCPEKEAALDDEYLDDEDIDDEDIDDEDIDDEDIDDEDLDDYDYSDDDYDIDGDDYSDDSYDSDGFDYIYEGEDYIYDDDDYIDE